MMAMQNTWGLGAMLALMVVLAGCDTKPAANGTVAQGATPEGTISDELPDLDLLPNDAPLADPVDQCLVPAVPGEAAPVSPTPDATTPASEPSAPAPVEPVEGSIAE